MLNLNRIAALTVISSLGFASISPEVARACGGTFCDSGPTSMPVDQTGENILFVLDGTHLEAHVQIQYQGEAERFAWVVPMQKVPEVTVGSQPLFDALLSSTVSNIGYNQTPDDCPSSSGGTGGTGGSGGSGFGGNGGTGGSPGGPSVLFAKTVGSFDVTALEGGTAQEVVNWLSTNGYQTIPAAASLLEDYVARGFVFVAVKLTADAEVKEIHPLVFRYEGTEPCVPIKLTAVAATENMGVRTFFLGDDRVMPVNYKHVVPNSVRFDWLNFGNNYEQAISLAVDSRVSNGLGFSTEYAGSARVVAASSLVRSPLGRSPWDSNAFRNIAARDVINTLTDQGLMYCSPGQCEFYHAMVMPILKANLVVPDGIDADDFYYCVACYADKLDPNAWNPVGFARDFEEKIVRPGKHAQEILALYPYLTRLFTTLSPSEMTEDPIFAPAPGLPEVHAVWQANLRTTCDGKRGMTLPDDRQVALPSGSWPQFDSEMPWAERIEQYNTEGELVVLVDNGDQIDQQLKKFNDANAWPPRSGGAGGADDQGCACSTPGGNTQSNNALLSGIGIGLLGLGLRRRRGARR